MAEEREATSGRKSRGGEGEGGGKGVLGVPLAVGDKKAEEMRLTNRR